MNSCPHAKDLTTYQLGLLEKKEKKRFETHLEQCPVCQQEMQMEAIVKEELTQKLEPGQIEQRVLANLRLRKTLKPHLSWLYMIRMGIYAIAMMVGIFMFIPWFLEYPINRLFNLNINFNLFEELSTISSIFSHIYILAIIVLILIGASSVYSYRLLHE